MDVMINGERRDLEFWLMMAEERLLRLEEQLSKGTLRTTATPTQTAPTPASPLGAAEAARILQTMQQSSPHPGQQIEDICSHAAQCSACAGLLVKRLAWYKTHVQDVRGTPSSSTFQKLPSKLSDSDLNREWVR